MNKDLTSSKKKDKYCMLKNFENVTETINLENFIEERNLENIFKFTVIETINLEIFIEESNLENIRKFTIRVHGLRLYDMFKNLEFFHYFGENLVNFYDFIPIDELGLFSK